MSKSINPAYSFTILAFFSISFTAVAADMPSKRECAICHVMWIDDFRTGKETLIEWQPGNVLMKDTQGVVSSEDICYSCHDGYVLDSRATVWKNKQHKTFVKPSKQVEVPDSLTLSNKGEIYCGTCHTPHVSASAPEADLAGLVTFLRKKNADSSLCEMCHTDQADYKTTHGHPVHISGSFFPDTLLEKGSKMGGTGNKVICQTCHKVHGARGQKIVVTKNNNSALCSSCHEKQKHLINSKHDLRLTLPHEKNIKQQLPSESGPCGACHVPHNAISKKLWARKLAPGNQAAQMCLTCHDPQNTHDIKNIGQHSHPINVAPSTRGPGYDELPLFSDSAARDSSGKIQCFTCHEVHQWDPHDPLNAGGKDIEGSAANSFLRMSNSRSSTLCLTCHLDKKQVVTSDHNLEVTGPEEKNRFGFVPIDSGPCGACHVPHNASGNKLWAKGLSGDKDVVSQLCTGCHDKDGSAKAKRVGENSHPLNVAIDTLKLAAPYGQAGKSLPLYDSDGNKKAGQKMVCLTCHEPHTWDPKNIRVDSDYAFKNIEGDHTNSFLRKANSPSSVLCGTCHTDKALVAGTAHDLNVSAPDAKNLRDQTVKESGQCGVCHLVHNSPNTVKLWARPLGRVKKHQGVMDALCTGCHAKRNIAKKKIPPIAWHPREKVIMNTTQVDKEAGNYTPLFDDTGKEVEVGNISCPSCHNAHQWSYLAREKRDSENPGGRGADKFLRTASNNTICVLCHGPEALFRYLYFHEPEMRSMFKTN
jgi:predicted CXXCH cytochrome family protein